MQTELNNTIKSGSSGSWRPAEFHAFTSVNGLGGWRIVWRWVQRRSRRIHARTGSRHTRRNIFLTRRRGSCQGLASDRSVKADHFHLRGGVRPCDGSAHFLVLNLYIHVSFKPCFPAGSPNPQTSHQGFTCVYANVL